MAKNHQRRLEALERRLEPAATGTTGDLRGRLRLHMIEELLRRLADPAYDCRPLPDDIATADRPAAVAIVDAFESQVRAVMIEFAGAIEEADRIAVAVPCGAGRCGERPRLVLLRRQRRKPAPAALRVGKRRGHRVAAVEPAGAARRPPRRRRPPGTTIASFRVQ
ncbi:MAG: hypothetical protein JO258_01415 [Alphaproteobacteria bacterium]|nr:hypothetical protein [Alphaproteobacteria bacterium]